MDISAGPAFRSGHVAPFASVGLGSRAFPYPAQPAAEPAEVPLTAQFDETARKVLHSGGKGLLTLPGKNVRNFDTAGKAGLLQHLLEHRVDRPPGADHARNFECS